MPQTTSFDAIWRGTRAAAGATAARSLAAGALLSTAAAALAGPALTAARSALAPGAGVDDMVGAVAVGVGTLAAGWLALGAVLLAVAGGIRAVGRASRALDAAARTVAPRALRQLLTAGVIAGVGLGVAGPATAQTPPDLGWQVTEDVTPPAEPVADVAGPADTPPAPEVSWPSSPGVGGGSSAPSPADGSDPTPSHETPARAASASPEAVADETPLPTTPGAGAPGRAAATTAAGAPTTSAPAAPAPAVPPPAAPARAAAPAASPAVTVATGDTLWDIAAAHLPAGAGVAEIAAAWPRWYEANRDVIGADPDLLVPGQQLVAPAEGDR